MKENNLTRWFGLEGYTCVVAGANGLLGEVSTRALVDSGATVIGIDQEFRKITAAKQVTLDLNSENQLHDFFNNLTKEKSPQRGWAFINCAYPRTKSWGTLGFENVSLSEWNENVSMQLGSTFHFTQAAVKFLKSRGGGSIINFGSIYGLGGPDLRIYEGTTLQNPSPYAAIKAGVVGLTRYVAAVYGPDNIRANVICPGGINDDQPQSFINAYESRTPLRRMGKPEDIGGVVAFLVSPSANYMSGTVIPVDGGWTAW